MNIVTIIIAAIIAILIVAIVAMGYVKAPADKAYIISGLHDKPKVLIGRAGIMIPFLERKDILLLKQITIDIKTNGYVPTRDFIGVDIDAVAKVRIMDNEKGLALAAKNFLNMQEEDIITALTDSLQGNMREIIGTINLKELNTDRKMFGDQVQEKAQLDMNALGIEIISCNIQKVEDENGLITALGQDNMSQIQKDASIAKANATRDIAIAQAKAQREANDAKVAAETIIAERNNELAIKQADLKKMSDTKKAEADAAYTIQELEQKKSIEAATVNANIVKAEREAELKKQEVSVQEESLNAQVRKQADADRYAAQQKAEAEKFQRIAEAEAKLAEQQKEAEGIRIKGEAEAKAIELKGKAEAEAIAAKGKAEAEAMDKKADAMKKYGQAAITQMIVETLPSIAEAVAKPYEQIDKITIIGGGNGDGGVNSVGTYVPAALAQTMAAVKEATGVDLKDLIEANGKEAKITRNINISGIGDRRVDSIIDEAANTSAEGLGNINDIIELTADALENQNAVSEDTTVKDKPEIKPDDAPYGSFAEFNTFQ